MSQERRGRPPAPLGRGVLYNLGGLAAPMAIAMLAIPPLAAGLGPARFGVLALAWSALAYLGLLNLGVGRAVVQAAAARGGEEGVLRPLVWTAVLLLAAVGAAAGAAVYAAAPWVGALTFRHDPALAAETAGAFRVLAAAVPFTVSAAALVGVLEARQRFGTLNAIGIPIAALNYVGPLLVLHATDELAAVAAVLVLTRALAWGAYLAAALAEVPALREGIVYDPRVLGPLLSFGGWVTVSHVVSPLMVFADRFVVAGVLSAAAVAHYAAPQEAVRRLAGVPAAVSGVLFPAFSATADPDRLARLTTRGTAATCMLVLPLTIVLATFPGELLRIWLGAEYAAAGAGVLRWLALGLLANGLARVPSALLYGRGRPELPGRLHLAELPLYAGLVWSLTAAYGIEGTAAAWALRAAVDAAGLFWLAARDLPSSAPAARYALWVGTAGASYVIAVTFLPSTGLRVGAAVAALAGSAAIGLVPCVTSLYPKRCER